MGTFLNTCKEVRKNIQDIENKIDETVIGWKKLDNGSKQPVIYFISKAEVIRDDVMKLVGQLEIVDNELEKDSSVRPYYSNIHNKCINFLNVTKKE